MSGRQGTGRLVGFAPWHVDCHQLGWKERNYLAEALPFFFFNFIAQAVDVGEGDILGEEPIKRGEERPIHPILIGHRRAAAFAFQMFLSSFQK